MGFSLIICSMCGHIMETDREDAFECFRCRKASLCLRCYSKCRICRECNEKEIANFNNDWREE